MYPIQSASSSRSRLNDVYVWRWKSHKDFNSSLDINDVPWTEQRAQKVIKKFSSRFWIGLALVKGSKYSDFHNKWYSNQQFQKIAIDLDGY